ATIDVERTSDLCALGLDPALGLGDHGIALGRCELGVRARLPVDAHGWPPFMSVLTRTARALGKRLSPCPRWAWCHGWPWTCGPCSCASACVWTWKPIYGFCPLIASRPR